MLAVVDDRLMLLDTPSLYFRAYYGVPDTMTAPDGMPINAVRGLLDFIATLVTTHRPNRLVACFDADWRPAFRVEAIPSYKAHRVLEEHEDAADVEQIPDTLSPQVPVIEKVLDAIGITRAAAEGYEADDVIGTLSVSPHPVDVVTGDRDLFQLIDDERGIRILYTAARGVGKLDIYDEAALSARYGIPGRAYADFALLRGDPSDGLPGVVGIGEKTAAILISTYGDLAGIIAALDDPRSGMKPAMWKKLDAAREYMKVAPAVVEVVRDIPLSVGDPLLPGKAADPDGLAALAERYGLGSSLARVQKALGWH